MNTARAVIDVHSKIIKLYLGDKVKIFKIHEGIKRLDIREINTLTTHTTSERHEDTDHLDEGVIREYLSRLEKLEKALLKVREGRMNKEDLIVTLREFLRNIESIRTSYPFNELRRF